MISCSFFGGLGNNLFQLATVYNLHKKYGFELSIPSYTDRGHIHIYGQSSRLELSELFDNEFIYNAHINKGLLNYTHSDVDLNQTNYTFSDIIKQDNVNYIGYFQSERYFPDIVPKNEFILSKDEIEIVKNKYEKLFDKKNISMHYRLGGDRTTEHMQHYHKNVSTDFYSKALEQILDYNPDEYNILVFTDNPKLCKEILKDFKYNLIFIDNNNNNVMDFVLMSLCDVNIVGNSTFSWWAAHLNQNDSPIVIVTESEWFGPGYKHFNLKDTFPESWIRL